MAAIHEPSQADLNAGVVTNTATATGDDPKGDPVSGDDTVTTVLEQSPAIALEKTAVESTYSAVGDEINYTFTVTNTGNVTLHNVTVNDMLAGVTLTGGPIATLAPGASDTSTFTAKYTITQADMNKGSVVNSATVSGFTDPGADPSVDTPDVNSLEDSETVNARIVAPIPTLGGWILLLLSSLMAGLGARRLRRTAGV